MSFEEKEYSHLTGGRGQEKEGRRRRILFETASIIFYSFLPCAAQRNSNTFSNLAPLVSQTFYFFFENFCEIERFNIFAPVYAENLTFLLFWRLNNSNAISNLVAIVSQFFKHFLTFFIFHKNLRNRKVHYFLTLFMPKSLTFIDTLALDKG